MCCAMIVAGVGVNGLLQGLFARNNGIEAYKERNLLGAVEYLNTAYASPFKNRQVLDYLGLTHKNIADQAVDGPVAEASYKKALDYFLESRVLYPRSPYAKNGMINIYRRKKDWDQLVPLASSFESEIKASALQDDDGGELPDKLKATFLVTLGNVFADQDNPFRSDEHAVTLYQLALGLDPDNLFAVLNMPPRLIDMARALPAGSVNRTGYLQQAYDLSVRGTGLDEPRDKVFSVLAILQILMLDPALANNGYSIADGLALIDRYREARADFDVDTWFILAEAYLAVNDLERARDSFYQALIYQARSRSFTAR